MEDGYYEVAGSFFVCREVIPTRIDGRLRDIIGPVIHYDTEHLREPSVNTYFEESLHYLQWLHQTPRQVLDKIIGWRAFNEQDPAIRALSYKVMEERKLELPFETATSDRGIVQVIKPGDRWWNMSSIDLRQEQDVRGDAEWLARLVLYEAAAELMRMRFGVSDEKSLAEHFGEWEQRGISAWNKEIPDTEGYVDDDEPYTPGGGVYECFRKFQELPWGEFVGAIQDRNRSRSLKEIWEVHQMAGQGHSNFPADISHFIGYTLGLKLFQSGEFNGEAGMQEASLRLFSPLVSAIDRLNSLKAILD
jgi:hypothetical protein